MQMGLERAQEVRENSLWKYICEEIDYRIILSEQKLRSCSKDELPVLQNRVTMLEEFRRLPEDVIEREEEAV